jgi:hypothetical protein
LPWTDQPGPRPHRSEDQLLDVVHRRASLIRRRRWARRTTVLGGVVAVIIAASVAARAGGDGPTKLQVVGPAPTTSADATTAPPLPSSTSTSTPLPPTVAPATTRSPTTRETAPAGPTTTAARPTTVAPTTTPSTAPPALRPCDPGDVVVTATPDRSSYPRGATVNVLAAGQNRSSRACQPLDPQLEIRDAAGNSLGGGGLADAFTMPSPSDPRPSWDPGETLSISLAWPLYCGGPGCPPGSYTATVVFGPFRSPPAPFTVA